MPTKLTGQHIVESIKSSRIKPADLSRHQRLLCVQYFLAATELTAHEIAEFLDVSVWTIYRDQEYLEQMQYKLIDSIEVERVVKRLMWIAKICQSHAKRNKDVRLFWQIECDLVDRLGRIGIIPYRGEYPFTFPKKEPSYPQTDEEMDKIIEETEESIRHIREMRNFEKERVEEREREQQS